MSGEPRPRGSHAPSLRTLVRRCFEREIRLPPESLVLVACSGGTDSSALLHALAGLRGDLRLRLAACGVDHRLRPAAAEELAGLAALAGSLDVPVRVVEAAVSPGADLQARARDARYVALRAEAARLGATAIATAHTLDDRAETVLLRLLRGATAEGLAVLPPRSGDLVRPLVRASRAAVALHLARHGVPHAVDPSNADPRFTRVRVRRELLPLLAALAPRIVEHLASLADELGALPRDAALTPKHRRLALRAALEGRATLPIRLDDREEACLDLSVWPPVVARRGSPRRPPAGRSGPQNTPKSTSRR